MKNILKSSLICIIVFNAISATGQENFSFKELWNMRYKTVEQINDLTNKAGWEFEGSNPDLFEGFTTITWKKEYTITRVIKR